MTWQLGLLRYLLGRGPQMQAFLQTTDTVPLHRGISGGYSTEAQPSLTLPMPTGSPRPPYPARVLGAADTHQRALLHPGTYLPTYLPSRHPPQAPPAPRDTAFRRRQASESLFLSRGLLKVLLIGIPDGMRHRLICCELYGAAADKPEVQVLSQDDSDTGRVSGRGLCVAQADGWWGGRTLWGAHLPEPDPPLGGEPVGP